ncbi:transposase [bacterium]|nr:transposase [bacterium]
MPFSLSPAELHQFYHGRQTIENFFKESTGPFNAGKLPSQKLRGNEAYLHLVAIAENCCVLFNDKVFMLCARFPLIIIKPQGKDCAINRT